MAEQPFRAGIPAGDDSIQIFADDGVVRRLDDRGEAAGIGLDSRQRLRGQSAGRIGLSSGVQRPPFLRTTLLRAHRPPPGEYPTNKPPVAANRQWLSARSAMTAQR